MVEFVEIVIQNILIVLHVMKTLVILVHKDMFYKMEIV
jgi:hypothetical protein